MERINGSTKANASGCSKLHDSRFRIFLFIFRMGGHPLKSKSVSRINAVYNSTVRVCYYITTLCLTMETIVFRHNLEYAMNKFRGRIGFILVILMHLSFR
jgi:hypothetical protein